jgi:c-di-GMP-binding flagellar brake protein YcgR
MSQRTFYRVGRESGLDDFELELRLSDGRRVAAQLCDLSAGGLTAQTGGAEPTLHAGSALEVELSSTRLGISVRVPARVCNVRESTGSARYGIRFQDARGLQRKLPAQMCRFFNRRGAPRATLGPHEQVDVALRTEGTWHVRGHVHDLSVSGAAVWLSGSDARRVTAGSAVRIVLTPERGGSRVELEGRVRWTQETDGPLLCGIAFDPELTRGYEQQRREIERLIAGRPIRGAGGAASPHARIVNRRVAQRVRPKDQLEITVEICGPGERSTQARLRDISATGMAVTVVAEQDPEFGPGEEMALAFRLGARTLDVVARVRRGLLIDDVVCYGLEFDSERSPEFAERSAEIRDFVREHALAQHEPSLRARLD